MSNRTKIIALLFCFVALAAGTTNDVHLFKKAVTMASTLGIDTISEYTSGSGVTIDSLEVKDGAFVTAAAAAQAAYFQTSDGSALAVFNNFVTDDTDSGAGTQVLSGVIPAGATSLGLTCIVDTVIVGAGAASMNVGDGTDADLYGTAIAFAAGTTVTHADYTASPMTQAWSASAGNITLTANAGQFDTGTITCCSSYIDTKPAS